MAYTEQNFVKGQVLKAEHLNKMERELAKLSIDVENIEKELKDEFVPDYLFTKYDMLKGAITTTSTPSSSSISNGGMYYVLFDVKDVNKDLYATFKAPSGYYIWYYISGFDATGKSVVNNSWTLYSGQKLFNNVSIKSNANIVSYGISICFSASNANVNTILAAPSTWEFNIYEEGAAIIDQSKKKPYVIIDINGGGDYTSVVEAVANEPENTTIFIMPGTYVGTVQAFTKRIILIGVDRESCILMSKDGRYDYPPVNGSCGYLANLTFHHKYESGVSNELGSSTNGGYAFHCENEYGAGKTLEFHNCTLISDFFPALGAGLRKDFHLIIDNCELISNQPEGRSSYTDNGSLGALYFHDSAGVVGGGQKLTVRNSVLKSKLDNVLCPYTLKKSENIVTCEFINNVFYSEKNGMINNIWHRNGNAFTDGYFALSGASFGNSNDELNAK